MPFSSVEKVTVSSGQPLVLPGGAWMQGRLIFTAPDLAVIGAQDVTLGGAVEVPLIDGAFSVQLVATDASGMSPTGWTYKVTATLTNAPDWIRYITLPKATASVVLADVIVPDPVAGTYTVLLDQAAADARYVGLTGDQTVNGEKNFGTAIPVGPGFDPAFGNQLARKAYVDAAVAAGGGGGSTIRTAGVRVMNDNLSGLPSAAAWTITQTSAATKLQCSIAATAGDRILVHGNFMRSGSHFLDWTLLDSAGAIALYAGSGTSSPLPEDSPPLYPSLSFSYATAAEMFTVASGHINSGLVTVALAHQGTGAGLVYAHTTYPFRMRLENIGPEPA